MTFRCDLSSKKVVSYDEAKELADSLGVQFMETSAKNSHNVEQARLLCCKVSKALGKPCFDGLLWVVVGWELSFRHRTPKRSFGHKHAHGWM